MATKVLLLLILYDLQNQPLPENFCLHVDGFIPLRPHSKLDSSSSLFYDFSRPHAVFFRSSPGLWLT